MSLRTVTGKLLRIDGSPWRSAILFSLVPTSFDGDAAYLGTQSVVPDSNGEFSISLWANEDGEIPSVYVVRFPNGETDKFVLPAGDDPIDLSVLRLAGITPSDPDYQTLLTWIEENVGGGSGDSFHYEHDQPIAAAEWTIVHGGGVYPSVTIVDTDNKVIDGEVEYLSADAVKVTFAAAFSGKAYLN